jgi:hypothetical protein
MKRFWLLLLAFVLPLQMSWAAVHFCDDTPVAAAASAVEGHAHQAGEHHAQPEQGAKTAAADACCIAAHGCHGLHSLMAQEAPVSKAVSTSGVQPSCDAILLSGLFDSRVERPQWSAA